VLVHEGHFLLGQGQVGRAADCAIAAVANVVAQHHVVTPAVVPGGVTVVRVGLKNKTFEMKLLANISLTFFKRRLNFFECLPNSTTDGN
jgi:hypothetical protein